MPEFVLHHRLTTDTVMVKDLVLSRVLLMNDARFPWLILVPRRADIRELHELEAPDRILLMEEIAVVGKALQELTSCTKMNVGALGNVVSQLHVHVIGRREGDPAWPGPAWGSGHTQPYSQHDLNAFHLRLVNAF